MEALNRSEQHSEIQCAAPHRTSCRYLTRSGSEVAAYGVPSPVLSAEVHVVMRAGARPGAGARLSGGKARVHYDDDALSSPAPLCLERRFDKNCRRPSSSRPPASIIKQAGNVLGGAASRRRFCTSHRHSPSSALRTYLVRNLLQCVGGPLPWEHTTLPITRTRESTALCCCSQPHNSSERFVLAHHQ